MFEPKTVKFSELTNFSPKQKLATETADKNKYTLYGGAMGGGKAQSLNSLIRVPTGWKRMGDLVVGDKLVHPKGGESTVIKLHEQGVKDIYEFEFIDGAKTLVTDEHLWQVRYAMQHGGKDSWKIKTTKELIVQLNKSKGQLGGKKNTPAIPFTVPVEFGKGEEYPYLVGLILGDGGLTGYNVILTTGDSEIVNYINTLPYKVKKYAKLAYCINGFQPFLRELGLFGKGSLDKFIPEKYKLADIETRREILRGLMDTDGYVDKRGHCVFTSISPKLAKDVQEIIWSLGGKATITSKQPFYRKNGIKIQGKTAYNVYIQTADNSQLFKLTRKKNRCKIYNGGYSNLVRRLKDIKYVGKEEARCITIDKEDGLYLTDDYIVTHNSYWLRWYSIRWLIKTHKETGIKGLVAALFCEDYPTLKDRHLGKLAMEMPEWLGSLKEDKAYGLCFKLDPAFGEGVLVLRNLDDPSKYASSEFGLIAIDELTKDPREVFDQLRTRMRWPGLEDTKFVSGTNPGSIGHDWVKRFWVDKFFDEGEKESHLFAYVKATAKDNPYISQSYLHSLDSLPEKMRRAFLDGDWDLFEGQAFTEFNREKHVIPTVNRSELPKHWINFRSIDVSGRNGITACYWYVLDGDGVVRAYREYYWTGKDSDQHAEDIWKMSHPQDEAGNFLDDEGYRYTVMDSAAWAKMGMPETTSEVYLRKWAELDLEHGVSTTGGLVPSEKHRVMGWDMLHSYLRWDDKHDPQLLIMDCCRNLIRTIPLAVIDEKNSDDIDTTGDDHGLDATRYLIQTLRDQKTPAIENMVQRRLRELKELSESDQHNYSYNKF